MGLFDIPKTITGTKARWAYRFFKFKYTFDQGKNKSVGLFGDWFTEVMILILFLGDYGITFGPWQLLVIMIITIIVFTLLGSLILKYKIDKLHVLVNEERNPMMNDVYKNQKNKEKF